MIRQLGYYIVSISGLLNSVNTCKLHDGTNIVSLHIPITVTKVEQAAQLRLKVCLYCAFRVLLNICKLKINTTIVHTGSISRYLLGYSTFITVMGISVVTYSSMYL